MKYANEVGSSGLVRESPAERFHLPIESLRNEDRQENLLSIREGFRIMSAYTIHDTKLWVITEADRSSTTILLPEEY